MTPDLDDVVAGARAGRARDVARLISLVEDGGASTASLVARSAVGSGASIVGITGAPGVGKSTITSALITGYRARDLRVGVLAIDPSSPFSGGALLGDRIRMQAHATDPGVFIRSMAARGHLGGIAASTSQVVRVLEVSGFDVVLIETVGVGQSEVEIAAAADTAIVLVAPGMGDSIQAAKAGILEIADVLAVNKADRDGADGVARELRSMVGLGSRGDDDWTPRVIKTTASTGEGVDILMTAIDEHRAWLTTSGELSARRLRRARDEIAAIAIGSLRSQFAQGGSDSMLDQAARAVVEGRTDAYAAAAELVALLR